MRYRWAAVVLLVAGLFGTGPAGADAAGAARTDDGFGVLLGAPDAPVRLEIFCEPQCPECAKFEAAVGDRLVGELGSHRVAVTYRWLTFLDQRRHSDVSAQLSNALMLAADPATAPVTYQNFVAELYRQQSQLRESATAEDIAAMARASGVPGPVADRIAAGEWVVDTAAMDAANRARLNRVYPENPGTPTVYNLGTDAAVDTEDADWLTRLLAG